MKNLQGEIRLSATDVSNHLACRHLTELELSAARGERDIPNWESPDMRVIQELGLRHETKYLKLLEKEVGQVLNLSGMDEGRILEETRRAMESGVEAIAQGALLHGRFFGRPDVLRKVHGKPSRFGDWSYEAYDCKLSKETKATTILQLSFYSELLGEIQRPPNATTTPSPAPDQNKIEIQQIPKRLRLRRRTNFLRRLSPRIHVGRPTRKRNRTRAISRR